MSLILDTALTFATKSIATSGAVLNTYTNSTGAAVSVWPRIRCTSGITNTAATMTPSFRILSAADAELGRVEYVLPKAPTTATMFTDAPNAPIYLENGQKLQVFLASSNTGDTSVGGEIDLLNGAAADVRRRVGTDAVLNAIPAVAAGTNGGLPVLDVLGQVPANLHYWRDGLPALLPNPAGGGVPVVAVSGDALATADQVTNLPVPLTAQQTADAFKLAPSAGSPATGSVYAAIAVIAGLFTGITSVAAWLRAFVRKDTPDSTALTEINTGGGTYSATTDSQEAIRDRGDAAWTGSVIAGQDIRDAFKLAPSAGAAAANSIDDKLATITAKTNLITTSTATIKVVSPVSTDGETLDLVIGDDYTAGKVGRPSVFHLLASDVTFASTDITTVTLIVADKQSGVALFIATGAASNGTNDDGDAVIVLTVPIDAADTGSLTKGRNTALFDLKLTMTDSTVYSVVADGEVNVLGTSA